MRKAMLIFGILAFICMVGLVIADVNSTQASEEQDKLNPLMRAYVNYEYDSTVSDLNDSAQPAVMSADASTFTIPISGSGEFEARTDDPNADLTIFKSGNSLTISDDSNYKYLFNVQMRYSDIEEYVQEGKVRMVHVDDTGNVDAEWSQAVQNVDGYVYFQNLPFTSVTVTSYGVGYAYLPDHNLNYVSVINLDTYLATALINLPAGSAPVGIAVNHAGTRAYVANEDTSTVTVINTLTNTIVTTLTVFGGSGTGGPRGIAVSRDDSKIYVSNYQGNTVQVISAATNAITKTITVGTSPLGITINHAGTLAYVANADSATISVITTSSDTVTSTIPYTVWGNSVWIQYLEMSPDDTKLYVSAYDPASGAPCYVYQINAATGANISRVSVPDAGELAISADGLKVYASHTGNSAIDILNTNPLSLRVRLASTQVTGTEGIWAEPVQPGSTNGRVFYCGHSNGRLGSIWVANDTFTGHNVSLATNGNSLGNIICIGVPQRDTLAPTASFTYSSPSSGPTPLAVTFTDTSTNTPLTWDWDYGDGTTHGTTAVASHTYTVAGLYTVTLNVTNAAGYSVSQQTSIISATVPVYVPVAGFSQTATTGAVPLTVQFTDTTTNSPTSEEWYFGEGFSTNGPPNSPSHTYSTPGTYTVWMTATNSAGSNTITKTNLVVTAIAPSPVSFSGTPRSGAIPLAVQFTDTSPNSPTSWTWNFGDGSTSTAQNPAHTYTTAGSFTVTHTSANVAGTGGSIVASGYITAYAVPVAGFTATPTTGTSPRTVQFTDQSSNTPTSWSWNFGDSTSSTLQSPSHQYANPGTYTVALTATNPAGSNTNTKSNYISISAPVVTPVAEFVGSPTSGGSPLTVQFTDQSSNGPTSWSWNFGDSTSSTAQSPSHQYTAGGTYTVAMTATNSAGSNTKTRTNYITVAVPVASFTATPTSGTSPLTVQFTDASTGSPTAWSWNFGDSTSSTSQSPSHQYANAGTYTVSLTASSLAGSNTLTRTNYVAVSSPVVIPTADFTGSPTSGNSPLTVQFTDSSSNGPTSWAWSFGDGTANSTAQNPSHQYTVGGTYTVVMTATNSAGSSGKSRASYITVAVPVAGFTATPVSGVSPLTVQFTDSSTGAPTSWAWNFGDGQTSTTQNPSHQYASGGTYTVALTASSAAGSNTLTRSGYITVSNPVVTPVSDFIGTPTSGGSPLTVQFTDQSSNGPTSWSWNFGDSTTSTATNPSHVYSTAGTYTVSLTATNSAGSNSKTRTGYIAVSTTPSASFTTNVSSGATPLCVLFTDTSSNTPTSWSWNFGDAGTSTSRNPVHTYSSPGIYTVSLTATNTAGSGSTTSTNAISVVTAPVANFISNQTAGVPPTTIQFNDTTNYGSDNKIVNGDIEAAVPTNLYQSYTTATQSTAQAYTGTRSLSVISTSGAQGASAITIIPVPSMLSASTQYYWEAWVYSATAVTFSPSYLYLSENGGGWRSTAAGSINGNSATQTLPAGVWTKVSGVGTTNSDWGTAGALNTVLIMRPAGTYGAWDTTHAIYYDDIKVYPSTWIWNFGDGNTSTVKNPTHTYYTVGQYNVSLTATNTVGTNTMTKTNYITAAPLTITPAVSNIVGWNFENWTAGTTDFAPDGWVKASSVGMSRSTDAKVGNYSIMLSGSGSGSYTGLTQQQITIPSAGYYNLSCWMKSNGVGNGTVVCSMTNTTTWTGTFPGSMIANGSGDNQWHYYSNRVYITDVGSTVYIRIYTDGYPSAGFRGYVDGVTLTPDVPRIAVTESDTGSHLLQSISSYTPTGVYANSVFVTRYNTYNLSDATQYTVVGCIGAADSVNRTAYTDSNGNIYVDVSNLATSAHTMSVDTNYTVPIPAPNFTANRTIGGTPLAIQFTDTSTNHPTSWAWSWGDGTANGTTQNPIHSYAAAGTYTVTMTGINTGGSSTISRTNYITVVNTPVTGFTKNVTFGPQPLAVAFTDNSTNTPTSWRWTFGDGGISTVQNPVYTYTNAGTYTVTLNATNAGGTGTYSWSNAVTVLSTTVNTQAYAYIPNYGNATLAVVDIPHFTISKYIAVGTQPYGVAVTNDGTKAYVTNYNGGASSTVSVINTVTNTLSTSVSVGNGAQGIVVTPTNTKVYVANNASNTVTVINTTTNSVTSTIAGFSGPSGIAISPDGTKVYVANGGSATGTVNIINTATDTIATTVPGTVFGGGTPALRGVATSPDGVEYYVSSLGNGRVYAVWAINNTQRSSYAMSNPNQITTSVNGSKVYVTTLGGSSYETLNNGTLTSVGSKQVGSNSGTEGIMADPFGVYTYVVGRATNTLYYLYTDNNTFVGANVTGFSTPYAYGIITRPIATIAPPITAFTANRTTGDIPMMVQFNDTSLNAPTQWYWDFGDGGISAERNPTHTYMDAGNYTVTLTTTNIAGSTTATNANYITVNVPVIPSTAFTASPTYGGLPLTVYFTDTTLHNPTAWFWEFGDGNTSTLQNPSYTYTTEASFTVRLTTSNGAGSNSYTVVGYITAVSNAPHPEFYGSPLYGITPFAVQFNDTSTNGPTSWTWRFGDGSTSTDRNATHTYTRAGAYTVSLRAQNEYGASYCNKSYYVVASSLTAPTYAYIPNYNANTVSVVNLAGANIIKTIPVGVNPFGICVNSVGTEAYITNYNNGGISTVSAINTTMNEVTNTMIVGNGSYGIAITPDCTKAYVANSASNTVSVIDATTHIVINTIYGFDSPIGVTADPSGSKIYVSNNVGTVSVVSTVTDTITRNISSTVFGSGSPLLRGMTVSSDGRVLYVASSGNNKVYALWTDNYTAAASVNAEGANCLTITPDGDTLYSTSFLGTTLQATNLASVSPSATLPLGVASDIEGITADPNGEYVYVLGAASDTLYYVYTANNTVANVVTGFSAPYAFGNIMRQSSTPPTAPSAQFTADRWTAWIGYPVQFTDLSAGLPTSWYWDFGDGNISLIENPVHAYYANASYTVSLVATNDHGSDTIIKEFYMYIDDASAPGTNFTATPTRGYIPLTVQFTDNSTNNPRAWAWSFGDGGGSNLQNPTHTYTTADAYTVSLTTENAMGDSTATIEYYITADAQIESTDASFTATPTTGEAPLTVYFTDTSAGIPTSWLWDFGDGTTSTFMNPSHTYTAIGAYTVSLTTTNDGGVSNAREDYYITVTPTGGLAPSAAFTSDYTSGIVPFSVQFTDQSIGTITSWLWDFGDGTTSIDQYPSHIYSTVGTYTVSLTAANDIGIFNTTTIPNYIYASTTGGRTVPLQVNQAPVSGFTSDITTGHTPFTVQFTDLSTNSPTNWTWVFGDGSTSELRNPSHEYVTAGRYDVTLVAVSPYGTNTVTKPGYIYSTNAYNTSEPVVEAPVACFVKTDTGTAVAFTDTSTNVPTSWAWDFGDGQTSTEQNPTHNYERAGDYTVTLTASNGYGSSVFTYDTSQTPQNYSQHVSKLFTRNMTGFDFLSHTVDFYTSFMPSWLFWCIILLIPFISMYNRQGGIILVGVLYLVTGGILSSVMPTVMGGAAFWFFVLGFAGILYKLFIPD